MNCLENENVCSVKKENNSGYYRLHTIWRKNGFFVNIASKNGAWRGEMTPNDISKICVQLKMEPESYLSLCKEALTCHGGKSGFVYTVEDGYFAWKKVEDEDSGIKIKMGSIMLEPASFVDTIQNLVTAALNCNRNLQEKLLEVTEKNNKILENQNELLGKLNELIKTKNTMENDLYSKFVLLINTKKRRIQESEILFRKSRESKSAQYKSSNSPYDVDTDNDSEEEIQNSILKGKIKASTYSKKNLKNCNFFSQEVPEDKKVQSSVENHMGENIDFTSSNYSCQPSTSKLDLENETRKKGIQKMALRNISTKDDLYDYFYGGI